MGSPLVDSYPDTYSNVQLSIYIHVCMYVCIYILDGLHIGHMSARLRLETHLLSQIAKKHITFDIGVGYNQLYNIENLRMMMIQLST